MNAVRAISVSLGVMAACLAGCKLAPAPDRDEVAQQALPDTTEIRSDWAGDAQDTGHVDDGWIRSFNDPQLEALVDEALENNLNLRLAATQVERAAGLARLAAASLKPTIAFNADLGSQTAGRSILGQDLFSGDTYGAVLGMGWEMDVWGKLRARARAGEEALAATVNDGSPKVLSGNATNVMV